jgi:NAD(P)H-dependent FMN reductase
MSSPQPRPLITIISGTNRLGCRTRSVAEVARRIYHDLGSEVWLIDLAAFAEGTYDPQREPAGFKEITDLFVAAKGVVVVTPSENGQIPNILKHFFSWIRLRVSLQVRPVAFIGLADEPEPAAAAGPVDQLHEIFGGKKNAYIYPIRLLIPNATNRVRDDGTIDETDTLKLGKHAEGFIGFCHRMRGQMGKF